MKETFTVDQLTNGGFTLNVIGRDYRFSELRMKDYGRLQNHLKRIQPKAVDVLTSAVGKLNMAPADLTEAILTANERDLYWPVSVDSPPGLSMIQNDDEARTDFVKFVLEKHQPSISTGEAREAREAARATKKRAGKREGRRRREAHRRQQPNKRRRTRKRGKRTFQEPQKRATRRGDAI